MTNHLYYGDNLEILRSYIDDETVDLIYLDPPFKSDRDYNVLFAEQDGSRAAAQIKAFGDMWQWDAAAARVYEETVEAGGRVSQVLQAFRGFLGANDMLAYLAMMAPRLVELRRTLKPTGSLYLHCDPTASHYLKILLDAVFGPTHFRNEITWKRTGSHGGAKRWGPVHDVILFYTVSEHFVWNRQFQAYADEYLNAHYKKTDEQGRRYQLVSLTGAGTRTGNSGKEWRGVNPTPSGRHWAVPMKSLQRAYPDRTDLDALTTQEKLDLLEEAELIHWPERETVPRHKRYADENPGVPIQDMISDIGPIGAHAQERLGYPTQKPEALLERIIRASSNEGDVVLDPFCGCGTAIATAQKLGRCWIGIDITHLAIGLIKHRLRATFGEDSAQGYVVIGEPVSLPDAVALGKDDPFQFQWWALGLVGARPVEQKKGADKGIDGRLYFHDDVAGAKTKQIIFSVKAGRLSVPQVRDLRGVIEREGAEIGVLLSLQDPTQPMRAEAASAGFYESPWGTRHPRLQLLTIPELLSGMRVDRPTQQGNVTFKPAPAHQRATGKQGRLFRP